MSGLEESHHATPILEDVDIVAIPRNYNASDSAWLYRPSIRDFFFGIPKIKRKVLEVTGAMEVIDPIEPRMPARELEVEQKKSNPTTRTQAPAKSNASLVDMEATPDTMSPMNPRRIVHWLKDEGMLRDTFKFGRILLLSLTSNLNPQHSPSIDEVAEKLLELLSESRKTCPERPIVFIGHDIGVMVIEKAVMLSSKGNVAEAQTFCKTAGVIFLSSPASRNEINIGHELDYYHSTSKSFSNRFNFRYRGFNALDYAESHLEKFRATLIQAEKEGPGLYEVDAKPSAISLYRYQYLGKIAKKEDVVYSKIIDAIASSLERYQLLSLAYKGNVHGLRSILDLGVGVNLQDRTGNAALHLAVINGQTETVEMLLHDFGANVALQNSRSRSALFLAVDSGKSRPEIVNLLLKNGARLYDKDKDGQSPSSLSKNDPISIRIQDLLKDPPWVEGPSEVPTTESWVRPTAPKSAIARNACKSFRAVVAEFFQFDGKESFVLEDPSVYHLLYKSCPESILYKAREHASNAEPKDQGRVMKNMRCRWYHIPANNVCARYI